VRTAGPSDQQACRGLWVHSFVRALGTLPSKYRGLLPDKATTRSGEWALAGRLMERSQTRMLCLGSKIVSFVVVDLDEPICHYAFTIVDERRKGHVRYLLHNLCQSEWKFTRDTPLGRIVGERLGGKLDPYAIYSLLAEAT
jgi:hypothetical protein